MIFYTCLNIMYLQWLINSIALLGDHWIHEHLSIDHLSTLELLFLVLLHEFYTLYYSCVDLRCMNSILYYLISTLECTIRYKPTMLSYIYLPLSTRVFLLHEYYTRLMLPYTYLLLTYLLVH